MENAGYDVARKKSAEALERVGLKDRFDNLPGALSGGEQQRASIARAVAEKPEILFADEPTANLDRISSGVIMDIFKELHELGQTIIMVTHEEEYARTAERIVQLDDGKIVSSEQVKQVVQAKHA